jgi:hypothetical protein
LRPDENNWLSNQIGVRTSICKNLHAKCYINEVEAIITSMNLYEFSQMNNNEMGIHVTKVQDEELYNSIFTEVQRLLTISEEIRVTVQTVSPQEFDKKIEKQTEVKNQVVSKDKKMGFCIRTGQSIPFNPEKPLGYEAFKSWNQFGDPNFIPDKSISLPSSASSTH